MYKAIVKWNGNHYSSGEEVKGSKIRRNQDGTVELFDDEPIEPIENFHYYFPYYGSAREEWVEVESDSIENLDDKVVFKLDKDLIIQRDLRQPNFLLDYCKYIESEYKVTIDLVYSEKEDYYSEAVITGPARNIQALIYDGMFEDLIDMADGNTEETYDKQHGQEYYGPWDM